MKRHQIRHSFTVALLLLLITPGDGSPLAAEIAPPGEQPAPAEKSEKDKKAGGQRSGAAPQRIHPDVHKRLRPDSPENLRSGADPRPFVMITLRNAAPPDATPKQKREFATKAQDDLLKKLAPGEFEVKHRFGSEPRAIGYIKASALDKLAHDDQVITVEISKIQPGIFAALQASPEGEAMVGVGLRREQLPENREERIAWIGKEQDRVLRRLHPGEFRLASKFKYIASFYGHIKLRGVEKLAIDNDVSQVYLDTVEYPDGSGDSSAIDPPESSTRTAMLEESVPFLGADAVHDLEYTGQDVTIVILDNGVDCSHPDIRCAGTGVSIVGGNTIPGNGDTSGVDLHNEASSGDIILIPPVDGYMLANYAPIEPPSGQDANKPQADQKIAKRPGPTKDPIHPDVRSKLEKSEDGKVYVLVTLKPLPKDGLTKEQQRKAMAKEKQDKLLAKLAEGQFTVDYRFETEPRMIGHLSEEGLAMWARNPDVDKVEPSKVDVDVFAEVQKSATGKAYVLVLLKDTGQDPRSAEKTEAEIKEIQYRVLAAMAPGEFDVAHKYSNVAGLAGYANAHALGKLSMNSEVVLVTLDKVYGGAQADRAYLRYSPQRTTSLGESILHLQESSGKFGGHNTYLRELLFEQRWR